MVSSLLKSLAGFALVSAVAQAVTVDFTTLTAGTNLGASYTSGAVTFVPITAESTLTAQTTPNGTVGLQAGINLLTESAYFSFIRATIAGGATSVSVDLGDESFVIPPFVIGDAETIFLEVYNSSNALLGSTSMPLAKNVTGMFTLSLSADNISYAVFGATGGDNGSSVYADNFTYTTGAVRTPDAGSTLALFAVSLGLIGLAARARKSAR